MKTYQELRVLQPSRWFVAWFFDFACITGAMVMFGVGWEWPAVVKWPVYLILFCVIGARQHAIAVLGHDGSHRNITNDRMWNDFWAKYLCFLPLGGCLDEYRLFHNGPAGHHINVGTDKDPELIHLHHPKLGKEWQVPLRWGSFWYYLVRDFVGGAIPHILELMKLTGPKRPRDILEQVVYFLVVISLLVSLGWWWVVAVWFGSIWLGPFWTSFRLRIWCEHVGLSGENHTHNQKEPNWLMKFLVYPHEIWRHLTHHKHAALAFYRLPAAQALDRLQPNYPPAVSCLEILKGLARN